MSQVFELLPTNPDELSIDSPNLNNIFALANIILNQIIKKILSLDDSTKIIFYNHSFQILNE